MLLWRYILLLIASKLSVSSGNACDLIFEMDIDNKGNIYIPVNTAVNAPFIIVGETCKLDTNFRITANKGDSYPCSIREINGQCTEAGDTTACRCTPEKKVYKFTRTLTGKDIGEWQWTVWVDTNEVVQKKVHFNLLFLKVNGKEVRGKIIVNQYETVLIECYWERGNQPIKIRLLDSTGKMLVGNTEAISHSHTFLSCQDTGYIRCETDGRNISLSANFLVICAPEIRNGSLEIINIPYGRNAEFTFIVSTPHVHTCEISHISKSTNDRIVTDIYIQNHQCRVEIIEFGFQKEEPEENITLFTGLNKCWCRIHGPISNSRLFLYINNISTNESGVWRLTVSNDLGNSSAFIYLQVHTGAPEIRNGSLEIINIPYGRNAEFTFIVSTPHVHTCEISHISKSTNDRIVTDIYIQNHQCRVEIIEFGFQKEEPEENITLFTGLNKCWCRIHGPISNSRLFLYINNISTNESGVWRLTVSNDLGNSSAFIYLHVYTDFVEIIFNHTLIISLISCFAILVSSAIITLVVYICKGRFRTYDRPRRKKHQAKILYANLGPQQSEDVRIYEEIRDVENTGPVSGVNSHELTTVADGDYDYPLAV